MPVSRYLLAVALIGCCSLQSDWPVLRAQEQRPVFRGGTTVIEVDVIVRDGRRQFVADLRAEDFEVLDDGIPQEISAVYRVIGPGDVAAGTAGAAAASPLPTPPPQQVQRVMVVFFDQAHMQPSGVDRAKKAALGFLQTNFRQGDVGGVLDGNRMVNNRLTSSKEELEAAVQGIKPAPEMSTILREVREWPRFVDIVEAWRVTRNERGFNPGPTVLDDVVARACRDRPDDCSNDAARAMVEAMSQNKATDLTAQARRAGKMTLDAVEALSNGMARLPGRKTLIMLTEGFFVEDAWADMKAVVGRAARASVRIYTLDTRGLNRGSASSDILISESPSQPGMSVMSAGDTNADGPNSLAVNTGGYAIRNENDFGKAFTEIDRDTSSYYIVGFRTSRPPDGKYHALSVRVKRSGVTVRARKGYVAATEAPPDAAGTPSAAAAAGDRTGGAPISPFSPIGPPGGTVPPAAAPPAVPAAAAPVVPGGVVPDAAAAATPGAVRATPRSAEEISTLGGGVVSPKAAASMPADVRKQASDGWEAYERGDVEKARVLLQEVTRQPSAPPWTHYVLGWSQLALGEAGPAAASWENVRGAVPQFEPVYFDLADAYQRQGEFAKAIDVLRDAEGRWPNDVEVYNALGVIQLARGVVDDAIATFTKGVSVNPKDANVCYNLAKTYEVRYVRGERLRKAGPGSGAGATALDDRSQAIAYYQRVVALGGPLVGQAKEGLKRLGQ
jgi:VWFA-related protein